ncbi:MAG: antirestriction protein ArdA [Pseudomonadota bacterium]
MTLELYAQPCDISATGFFFETWEEYRAKAARAVNAAGQPVEEFEIQFIEGDPLDAALAQAIGLSQANLKSFFDCSADWDDHQKLAAIVAVGECGYHVDLSKDDPDDLDLDIYEDFSLRDLAIHFVAEGLFGEVPERLANYLDFDAIGRDLGMDYAETEIAGQQLVYRCG